jgi:hypothetical protein
MLSTVKPLRFAPTRVHGLAGLTADAPKPEVGPCSRAIALALRWNILSVAAARFVITTVLSHSFPEWRGWVDTVRRRYVSRA